ncbi:unnamed protein product [Schistosoma margrebowiei]|uniref:Uncharacterized protein n=1 Tax=Schistosoma margrebowiei TaxID=48269 RepID=A0A183M2I9_9TREM|nr:unnamed protein product [Schistosoma margrebowiei]
MVVEGSQQEILNPGFLLIGTRQQGALGLFLRELMFLDRFNAVSPSFKVRDVTTIQGQGVNRLSKSSLSTIEEHLEYKTTVAYAPLGVTGLNYRLLNIPCGVCGDRSTGKHYGVYSCDGCSGFFKRSIHKNRSYTCKASGNLKGKCTIDRHHRNHCRACRLNKCFLAQMNEESKCILSFLCVCVYIGFYF